MPNMPETGIKMAALTLYLKLIKKIIRKIAIDCQLIVML
jgi:hypothetical protein